LPAFLKRKEKKTVKEKAVSLKTKPGQVMEQR